MIKKSFYILFSSLFFIVLLTSCNTTNSEQETGTSSQPEEERVIENEKTTEEEPAQFVPKETDVVFQNGQLKNKDLLEEFMQTAGMMGNDNSSEIRVVKYFGSDNFMIYNLRSNYSNEYDQRWIEVNLDRTYYKGHGTSQDVFNNASQQCGWLEKDTANPEDKYYKFFECRTNWEYRFLPVTDESEVDTAT